MSDTLTGDPPRKVATGAAKDDSLASPVDQPNWDAWQEVIDQKLIEWGRDPAQLAEDDLIPPTRESVRQANRIALAFRDTRVAPTDAVVPDGDGGIAFERWEGDLSETLEISDAGEIEYVQLRSGHVAERHLIS